MFVVLRIRVGRIRAHARHALLGVLAALVLVLVPGIGLKLNGARQWFDLGFANLQPSEVAKLVFGLWGAHVLATRGRHLTVRTLFVPVLPVFGVLCLLLIAEPDFGSVVTLGLVLAGLLWAAGMPLRYAGWAVLASGGLITLLIKLAPYRAARVTSFLDPFADPLGSGLQAVRGMYALATGGLTGVGLGNSRMKWDLLPHAESDYIFAIIGEELGFLGCCVVILLYGVLAYAGFRIARRSTDRFIQLASTAITVWLVGQAAMNMGYVVGLLPVTGVTLPLISAGGTSLVLTLAIVGLLGRFALSEPEAIAHRGRTPRRRLARLLLPLPEHAVDPVHVRRPAPARRTLPREAPGRSGSRRGSTARGTALRGTARGTAVRGSAVPARSGRPPRPAVRPLRTDPPPLRSRTPDRPGRTSPPRPPRTERPGPTL
jgi:cell division protein FtsW